MKTTGVLAGLALMCALAACGTGTAESFNVFGDELVIVEADYPIGGQPSDEAVALMEKAGPGTFQKGEGDRYVFLVEASGKEAMVSALEASGHPEITVFEHPFYDFNRARATGEAPQRRLDHAVMTCNMVEDPQKQAEYLDYHARQGELFPEVATGFARAGYEQVMVYRHGRRLMLIISYPQGRSLSELDPLTTKDNPRVDVWNGIMAGYQENIDRPGDAPWMMYAPVDVARLLCVGGATSPGGYNERTAMQLLDTIEGTPFTHTDSPDAAWYPQAGFGLFIHWGIHSVAGGDPSWSMLSNVPWLSTDVHIPHDKYYRLAREFNPSAYDPEEWVKTAKETGFTYLVITAKHHDGYCLWPSEYGEYSTRTYMDGRDLIGPLVAACRKYGLKIGLYFSPRDWSYPGYPVPFVDWNYASRNPNPYGPEENQRKYDAFFRYTVGQMSEILTRYGAIDVLWFDGIGWGGVDTHADILHAWLRKIQPGMVVNPRWEVQGTQVNFGQTTEFGAKSPFGDFRTEEISWRKRMTEGRPYPAGEWWEFNETWSGHWGYSPGARFRDFDVVIAALVYARSFGGNYLPDVGPQPDGGMRPGFYEECAKIKAWMDVNRESVIGTSDYEDWQQISNLPLTIGAPQYGDVTYAHFLKGLEGPLEMTAGRQPKAVTLLSDGDPVPFTLSGGVLRISLPEERRGSADDVVKIVWDFPLK